MQQSKKNNNKIIKSFIDFNYYIYYNEYLCYYKIVKKHKNIIKNKIIEYTFGNYKRPYIGGKIDGIYYEKIIKFSNYFILILNTNIDLFKHSRIYDYSYYIYNLIIIHKKYKNKIYAIMEINNNYNYMYNNNHGLTINLKKYNYNFINYKICCLI